jgi:hypothetical protein
MEPPRQAGPGFDGLRVSNKTQSGVPGDPARMPDAPGRARLSALAFWAKALHLGRPTLGRSPQAAARGRVSGPAAQRSRTHL